MVTDRLIGAALLAVSVAGLTLGADAEVDVVAAGTRGAPGASMAVSVEAPPSSTSATRKSSSSPPPPSSSSSSPAPSTTVASTTSTTGPAAKATGPEGARASAEDLAALARRGIVVAADLPSGFVEVTPPPKAQDQAGGPFERCLGTDAARLTAAVRAKARSGEFGKSGVGTLSSSSAVFDRPETAAEVLAVLGAETARSCFEGLINGQLSHNPEVPEDTRGRLTVTKAPTIGEGAVSFRFTVMLPADELEDDPTSEEVPYVADFVFLRQGMTLALFEFGNLREPFPAAAAKSVADSVLARL